MRNQRLYKQFVIILIVVSLILACGLPQAILDTPTTTPSTSGTVNLGENSDDVGEARIVDGPIAQVQISLPSLGKVEFVADTSNSVSLNYPADGSSQVLTLIDGSGLIWVLDIPGDALDQPQTIRMTALSDLKTNDVPLELIGGILLEPNGLKFVTPATLTVIGANLGSRVLILTGGQDGSGMELTLHRDEPSSLTAQVTHFSTIVTGNADNDDELNKMRDRVTAEAQVLSTQVKNFLKNKDIQVPVPPSLPIECVDPAYGHANSISIQEFVENASQPEKSLIEALEKNVYTQQLLASKDSDLTPLISELYWRLEKKAALLIKTYSKQPEKFMAITSFALRVNKDEGLVGVVEQNSFLNIIANWADQLIKPELKEVINNHDYKKANAAYNLLKWASTVGVENTDIIDLLNKISRALTFKVKITLDQYDGTPTKFHWVTESETTVFWKGFDPVHPGGVIYGSGTGKYITATSSAWKITPPASYPVQVAFKDFNPCVSMLEVGFNRFASEDGETYSDTYSTTLLWLLGEAAEAGFNRYYEYNPEYEDGDFFVYIMFLQSGNVTAAEETFTETVYGQQHGTLTITVTHTPR